MNASRATSARPSALASGPCIRVLPDDVKSRIAAGEVIERPASVLKELVENALDAGANAVHVSIEGGGRDLVRVSDDGCGMSRADLERSVLRHATSKLRSADDLYTLATLGFRGEALPSIGSVSRMTLTTRARLQAGSSAGATEPSDEGAWRIVVEGGASAALAPAAGACGTTVEVRDLFYNLPARKKFLKGAGAEAAACADTLLRLALLRPEVAFTLTQGRQELLACAAWPAPGGSGVETAPAEFPFEAYLRRAAEALGRDAARDLVPLRAEGPSSADETGPVRGYRLYGLVTPPARSRSDRSHIYLAVNGRAVKDRTLTTALLEAFRHLLPPKRYPAAVLYLECPGLDVDVNVHPTKAEVRFRIPGLIFSLFHHAVREAFAAPVPEERDGGRGAGGAELMTEDRARPEPILPFAPHASAAFERWRDSHGKARDAERGTRNAEPDEKASQAAEAPATFGSAAHSASAPVSAPRVPGRASLAERASASHAPLPPSPAERRPAPPFRIIGQAAAMYILAEDETGLRIFDQHALHERILFEELLARARSGRADRQGLLIPETLELTPAQAAAFASDEARAVLEELGFAAEPFGPRAVAVAAVPACLKSAQAATFVREVLEALAGVSEERLAGKKIPGREQLREKAAYVCSCKGAIKAGERLSHEQMAALLHEYHARVGMRGYTCPHGRPLAVELTWDELERKVGRS
ncbi:MAG: DNA mismatch repair endonuclease MutL [Planctomycetes bacterium]|nr:DNA mismatch repair endonuclease MutL [Planctomycetota bacterium]